MFAGASQFNGNGFMPSPDAQAGNSAQKKNYDQTSQSVRKVSIRQINAALEQSTSTELIVSGKELVNVSCSTLICCSFLKWAVFILPPVSCD